MQRVTVDSVIIAALLTGSLPQFTLPTLQGARVLEIGCGRGLAGIVAGHCGASVVVQTDCDDRPLAELHQMDLMNSEANNCGSNGTSFLLRHHLWEQDEAMEEAKNASTSDVPPSKIRHWSDSYRNEDFLELSAEDGAFDLLLASGCLYFQSQELPLAAVLRQRVKKPHGRAILVMQPRDEKTFVISRFLELLRASGFAVVHTDSFDWQGLTKSGAVQIHDAESWAPAYVPHRTPGARPCLHQVVEVSWAG